MLKHIVAMSESLEQWIKRFPQMSDDDINQLQQAVDEEKRRRHDRRTFQIFRRKCAQAGQECEDGQISDLKEESPGELAAAISQGIHKLVHTLQGCQDNLIRKAFQTWKSTKCSRSFTVSLKRSNACISID